MSKKPRKHYVPVDGTAVNPGWTIQNMRYYRRYGRNQIAARQRLEKEQEIKEQKREPVKVPAMF